MPTAQPQPVVQNTNQPPDALVHAIVARLAVLNSTDPTIAALLASYQTATGQPLA
jgi:hypothetical protein